MSHSVKRNKSKFEQFRMAVPADVQPLVGKSAWTQTLGTTAPLLAAELRGRLIAEYKAKIRDLRAANDRRAECDAVALLNRTFTRLAAVRGSMDAAIEQQLRAVLARSESEWIHTGPVF